MRKGQEKKRYGLHFEMVEKRKGVPTSPTTKIIDTRKYSIVRYSKGKKNLLKSKWCSSSSSSSSSEHAYVCRGVATILYMHRQASLNRRELGWLQDSFFFASTYTSTFKPTRCRQSAKGPVNPLFRLV